jgi:hypothetical protein
MLNYFIGDVGAQSVCNKVSVLKLVSVTLCFPVRLSELQVIIMVLRHMYTTVHFKIWLYVFVQHQLTQDFD